MKKIVVAYDNDLAIDSVDRIFATQIDTVVENPDTYFLFILDNEWTQAEYVSLPPDGKNAYRHSFITYLRNHQNI